MKFRTKLSCLFAGIVLSVATVISCFVYISNRNALESQIKERLEEQAFHTLDEIDKMLFERFADIKVLSTDPIISCASSTPNEIAERLIQFRNTYKTYTFLSFFNLDRVRVADTSGLMLGVRHPTVPYLQDALQGKVSAGSDVHVSETLRIPIIYFASPVKNESGEALGVVVARMPVSKLYDVTEQVARAGEEKNITIDLVNKAGLLLYSNHNRKGILKDNLSDWKAVQRSKAGEKRGSEKHRHPGEEETIYVFVEEQGYLDFPGNDWTLIMHIPTRVAFAPAIELRNKMIAIWSVITVFSVILVWFFSGTVSRPIANLRDAASKIGEGNLDTKVDVRSRDEIGELAASFRKMTVDLTKSRDELVSAKDYADNIVRSMIDTLIVVSPDGSIQSVNSATCALLGYDKNELIGKPVATIFEEEVFRGTKLAEMVEKGAVTNIEANYRARDGLKIPMSLSGSAISNKEGNLLGVVAVARDMRETQQLIAKLRTARKYSEGIVTTIPSGLAALDEEGRILSINPGFKTLFGDEDPTGRRLFDLFSSAKLKDTFERVLTEGGEVRNLEISQTIRGKEEPSTFSVSVTGLRIAEEEEEEVAKRRPLSVGEREHRAKVLVVFDDITELRKAMEETQKLVDNLNNLPIPVMTIDKDFTVTYMNPAGAALVGTTPDEALGMKCYDLYRTEHCQTPECRSAEAMQKDGIFTDENIAYPGGKEIPTLCTAAPVKDASGNIIGALEYVVDITEQKRFMRELECNLEELKRTQAQLVQSLKMSALGELASGVAHEMNNPLTGVLTYAILLKEKLENAPQKIRSQLPEFPEHLDLIKQSAQRCKSISDNLLAFSRQSESEITLVDLSDVISRTFDLIGAQMRYKRIKLTRDITEGLPAIRGNANQLQQAFTNIVLNAVQVMNSSGEITVCAKRADATCEVTVSDTGPGIPEEHLDRIFEPFFTTKPIGKGTGLGLSIVYGIVKNHGGEIMVDSVLGRGTTFKVRFPIE